VDWIFRQDDDEVTVSVRPDGADWRLNIAGQEIPLQVAPDGDGCWLVETHQGRRRLWVARRGDQRLVFCDGRIHTLTLVEPGQTEEDHGPGGGPHVTADMPGKVVQVLVTPGDQVTKGQTLVVMESMKMETELVASVAGVVAAVRVEEGEVVGQGALLVEITAEGESG